MEDQEAVSLAFHRHVILPCLSELFACIVLGFFVNLCGQPSPNSPLGYALFEFILLYLLTQLLLPITYTHLNPAITVAQVLAGKCRVLIGGALIFCQFFGVFIGTVLMRALLSPDAFRDALLSVRPSEMRAHEAANRLQGFLLEMFLASTICFFYNSSEREDLPMNLAGVKALCSFCGLRILGPSANPAVTLSGSAVLAVFVSSFDSLSFSYIPILADLLGALLSCVSSRLFHQGVATKRVST